MRSSNNRGLFILAATVLFVAAALAVMLLREGDAPSMMSPVDSRTIADSKYPFTPEEFRSARNEYVADEAYFSRLTDEQRRRAVIDEEWRAQAEFLPLTVPVETIVDRWRPLLRDERDVLTNAEEDRALRLIAEHARARAQNNPSDFRSLIERDPAVDWLDDLAPDPRHGWSQLTVFYDLFLERPFDAEAPPERILDEVWEGLRHYDHLYEAVGVGDRGALFIARRIRAESLLNTWGKNEPGAPEDWAYWTTLGSRAPMKFTQTDDSVESMIEQHESVLVVQARIIVRLRDDRLGLWLVDLLLDPASDRWVVERTSASATATMMTLQ